MSLARRRAARFGLWILAMAAGFGVAFVAAFVTDGSIGAQPDEVDGLAQAFAGFIAFGFVGLGVTWLFSRPRPGAIRWLLFGVPALILCALAAGSGFTVALMAYPLTWFAAFWAAWIPYEPELVTRDVRPAPRPTPKPTGRR